MKILDLFFRLLATGIWVVIAIIAIVSAPVALAVTVVVFPLVFIFNLFLRKA